MDRLLRSPRYAQTSILWLADDSGVEFLLVVAGDEIAIGSDPADLVCSALSSCSLAALISPESFCIDACPLGVLADTQVVQSFSWT